MKQNILTTVFVLLILPIVSVPAQVQLSTNGLPQPDPGPVTQQTNPPTKLYSEVVNERTANTKTWQRFTYEISRTGRTNARAHSHRFVQTAAGLHWRRNSSEPWQDTLEQINPLSQGGAEATNGPNQAFFPADLYSGVIHIIGSDGVSHFRSRPTCVALYDGTNSVLVAEITNCTAQISGRDIIWTNAFVGEEGFSADVIASYRKGGVRCDLVIRSWPQGLSPATYGLASPCRLELLTELFETPQPTLRFPITNQADQLTDSALDFGSIRLGRGRAFQIGNSSPVISGPLSPAAQSIPVFKTYQIIEQRAFLIEEVPFSQIKKQLDGLAALDRAPSGTLLASAKKGLRQVSGRRIPPPRQLVKAVRGNKIELVKSEPLSAPGLVLDYVQTEGSGPFVFLGDTTYYISEPIYPSSLVVEGGAVIKGGESAEIDMSGDLDCRTSAFRPAVFTSMNDDSVGEVIDGSTGTPAEGDVALFLASGSSDPTTVHDMRFAYCLLEAVASQGPLEVRNCQFHDVGVAVGGVSDVGLYNVLISRADLKATYTWGSLTAENVTADQVSTFVYAYDGASSVSLTNCLVTSGTLISADASPAVYTNCVVWVPSPASPIYRTVGGGSYYLVSGSTNRNVGTTNIDSALLNDLRHKTTFPPIVYSNLTISTNITLTLQAQRDTDQPDLGYHYDPLDYAFGGVYVTNSSVTVMPGTGVAVFGSAGPCSDGLSFIGGSQFTSTGTATNPVQIAEFSTVQEQSSSDWRYPRGSMFLNGDLGISCRFTHWSTLAQDVTHIFNGPAQAFKDCEFYGGYLVAYDGITAFSLTNCLMHRVSVDFEPYAGPLAVLRNNLFRGGTFQYWPYDAATIQDNFFDNTTIPNPGTGYYNGGHNAYLTNCDRLEPASGDIVLPSPIAYQAGPLGSFYQPADSPLIDKGSTNADLVGFYYYATTTNQLMETNSVIDIGFHYLATQAYLDSDGDGVPDLMDVAPNDPNLGILRVTIDSPTNNSVIY